MGNRGPEIWLAAGRALIVVDEDVTLETLCAHTKKTRGSFYYHFASVSDYFNALLNRWRQKATLDIIAAVEAGGNRVSDLNALASREDHHFERALRCLGSRNPEIGKVIAEVDSLREDYLARLAREELGLDKDLAEIVARLAMALFISGQMRAPDDPESFNAAAQVWLIKAATKQHP